MKRRGLAPKFDHELAAKMRSEGVSIAAVARHFGVSDTAVWRVTSPGAREKMYERQKRYQQRGVCQDCGGPCSSNFSTPATRCNECLSYTKILVRENEAWCGDCKEWLPKHRFGRASSRREVRTVCRACEASRRRDWRSRNHEHARVVERAHYHVKAAIKSGELVRPKFCEDCGGAPARIEAHHEDYTKPLDVNWLCMRCHRERHRVVRSDAVT